MDQPNTQEVTHRSLMQALSTDCELHAKAAVKKLQEVVEHFQGSKPLSAIGAFEGTTEIVLYIDTIMKRLAVIARRL